MAEIVTVSGSCRPTVRNTPLDERTRVNTRTDIENILYPFVGMEVYIVDEKKKVRVESLVPDGAGVPNAKIGTVSEVGATTVIDIYKDIFQQGKRTLPTLNAIFLYNGRLTHHRTIKAKVGGSDEYKIFNIFCTVHNDQTNKSQYGSTYLLFNEEGVFWNSYTASNVPAEILRAFGEANATTEYAGLMSAADKATLDGIENTYVKLTGGTMSGSLEVESVGGTKYMQVTSTNSVCVRINSDKIAFSANGFGNTEYSLLGIRENSNRGSFYREFPQKGGTFAMLSDIPEKSAMELALTTGLDVDVSSNTTILEGVVVGTNTEIIFIRDSGVPIANGAIGYDTNNVGALSTSGNLSVIKWSNVGSPGKYDIKVFCGARIKGTLYIR